MTISLIVITHRLAERLRLLVLGFKIPGGRIDVAETTGKAGSDLAVIGYDQQLRETGA